MGGMGQALHRRTSARPVVGDRSLVCMAICLSAYQPSSFLAPPHLAIESWRRRVAERKLLTQSERFL